VRIREAGERDTFAAHSSTQTISSTSY
jgi:hypothetical protein